MSNVTGNVMTLHHFMDFYYLEALRAGISMAKSAKPEIVFRRAFEKLESDVNESFDALCETMALRIWLYLWGAALGEAQYANENCDNMIPELENFGYNETFDYFPTEHNIEMVKDVFGQYWMSGGYGGDAWKSIVEGMELYGKISNAAFIDHAVDLEHNGGCVFDKTHERPFNLDCYARGFSSRDLKYFLDAKFSQDILNPTRRYEVSRKVYTLVTRYSNIVENVTAVQMLMPSLEWLSPFAIEWNSFENEFSWESSNGGMHCAHCGDKLNEDDAVYYNDEYYCSDCTTTCEHCDETVLESDTTYIDGECETWCDECVHSYSATCEECNKDYHQDNTICTEDDYTLCESCASDYKCEHCDEYYYNMDKSESHDDETETTTETTQDTPSDVETPLYSIEHKPVKLQNDNTVHMVVYSTGNLYVFDLDKYYKLSHAKKYTAQRYAIMTPCGLFFYHEAGTFESAIQTANMAEQILDWETIQTVNDWQKVPQDIRAQIFALTKLEVK